MSLYFERERVFILWQLASMKAPSEMRSEQAIFDDLTKLCSSPGYVHAIAYLCFRDNVIRYSDELKPEDMQQLFSKSRLIRTEISTLIGLLLKAEIKGDILNC